VGWAGPTQLTELDSAPKGLGQSLPKNGVGPISTQQFILLLLVWTRPGPDLKAGPESAWPRKVKTRRGIIFPSHPLHVERYFVLHAGGNEAEN